MNFEKASDREAHHLIHMDIRIYSMNAVYEAQRRVYRLLTNNVIDREKYVEVNEWIESQKHGLAQWRNIHPEHRYPVDPVIKPKNLTAEQRRRLAQQRKEPGVGGQ